jgi:hypothetical protein
MSYLRLTSTTLFVFLLLISLDVSALSFDGFLNTGALEYRGPTERNGYLLGINTNIFIFSDLALSLSENISLLDAGVYKGQKYANDAKLLNTAVGLTYIVDIMTLLPFIKVCGEYYKGNLLNDEEYDYGYSISAGVRYERLPILLIFELAYKQLYKSTTQWPSVILFSIGAGLSSDRSKEKETNI